MSRHPLKLVSVPTEGCTPKPNRLERVVLKFLFVTMGPEVSQGGTGWVEWCGGRRVRVRVRLSDQGWEGVGPSGEGTRGGVPGEWAWGRSK